jgi:hypothetical protein
LPENPLLPHRKLKELHALMLHCRALSGKKKSPAREALLAASAINLNTGDLIFAEADDSIAASLQPAVKRVPKKTSPKKRAAGKSSKEIAGIAEFHLPPLAAAAVAAKSLNPKPKNLVLAHTRENALEPNWQATLRFAQANKLPLLILCTGVHPHPGPRASQKIDRDAFTWDSVRRLCTRLRLPLLPVDGDDAVALYRVFQESTLHARAGAAPAVIWAMFHPSGQTPIARLQAYCRTRKIKL